MDRVYYTVKAEYAAQNKANIRRVVDELRALRRPDLSYSVFVEDNGKTFTHLLSYENEEAKKVFASLESFKTYVSELEASRPEVPSIVASLTLVGSTSDLLS